jgi:CBS domain-containing protein
MIVEPVTLSPEEPVAEALALMAHYRISGVPITDADGVLVGILTNRDLRFETDTAQPVSALMTVRTSSRRRSGRPWPRRSRSSIGTRSKLRSSMQTAA